uniref:Calponin-homology (CH) domain-containing protein n=1 Tax=Nothoprocta perdicaria TaxID=30464 RepID=A0A8C6YKL8_NOTPE
MDGGGSARTPGPLERRGASRTPGALRLLLGGGQPDAWAPWHPEPAGHLDPPWECPGGRGDSGMPGPSLGSPRSPWTSQPPFRKYDAQSERELRAWIEGVTGRRIGDNFMEGLKDGVILCEYGVTPDPLENIGNFLKGIRRYGVKAHDIFEANDLFENTNHTQVQSTLMALASQVRPRAQSDGVTWLGTRGELRQGGTLGTWEL